MQIVAGQQLRLVERAADPLTLKPVMQQRGKRLDLVTVPKRPKCNMSHIDFDILRQIVTHATPPLIAELEKLP